MKTTKTMKAMKARLSTCMSGAGRRLRRGILSSGFPGFPALAPALRPVPCPVSQGRSPLRGARPQYQDSG